MQALAEGLTVVVVGAWNAAIFSPAWISGRLTESQEIGLELPINNPSLPPRFAFDDILMTLLPDRLVLNPKDLRAELLERIQQIAVRVLEDLPHTPVRAVGVNFRFLEVAPAGKLLASFTLSDQGFLADNGATVQTISIRRGLRVNNQAVNLTLEQRENGEVVVDFNFHRDVPSTQAALEHLNGGVLNFRQQAVDLLKSTYEIDDIEGV